MSAPTERLARHLRGASSWHTIEHHPEVTSTNDVAHARVAEGATPGLVVVADRQTQGRGRSGRTWADVTGRSLLSSYLLGVPREDATLIPLAGGLAVVEALRRFGVRPRLKWPNDVLLGDGKVAGILAERYAATGDRPAHVVLGIGINVDWRGVERDETTASWASVAEEADRDVDRFEVLAELLHPLDQWLQAVATSPQRVLGLYRERCATIGREVRVTTADGEVRGRAVDLARSGALVLERPDGAAITVTAGDVVHLRRAG